VVPGMKTKIPIKKFTEDVTKSWEENYRRLVEHREEETAFLIKTIEELETRMENCRSCSSLLAADECARSGHTPCTHPFGCDCGYLPNGSVVCSRCDEVI
jgi:hypothetical protein